MTSEISLSIEETNKLRVSIGLAPIPKNENDSNEAEQKKLETSPSSSRDELSIEETNKLRLSLGLRPIPVNEKILSREEKEAENFKKHQSEIRSEERDHLLKQRIDTTKTRNLNRKRLATGKKLLENNFIAEESTDDWLKKLGQQKAPCKKQKVGGKGLDETNGLRIGHSTKELLTLRDNEIFTLRDTDLLEGNEDELTNETLMRNAKLKRALDDKRGADNVKNNGRRVRGFSMEEEPNELDENEDGVIITDSSIKLPLKDSADRNDHTDMESSRGKVKISELFSETAIPEIQQSYDYSKLKKPIKMKKLKKKASSSSRTRKEALEDTRENDNEILIKPVELESLDPVDLLTDEAELNSILSRKRLQKQKSRKFMTPDQIAREVKLLDRWDEENKIEDFAISAEGGMVYDDTSDFLNSLNGDILESRQDSDMNSHKVDADIRKRSVVKLEPNIKVEEKTGTLVNDSQKSALVEHSGNADIKNEDEIANVEPDSVSPSFNSGLASTLKFLQSRNILQHQTTDQNEKSRQQREALKEAELLKLKISIESRLLREQLEADKSFMNLPREEREAIFESHLDQILTEKNIISSSTSPHKHTDRNKPSSNGGLTNYNPLVKLSYRDESGNVLNTKEAFKYLSHRFHGVGPGKGKIDKNLKRLLNQRDNSSSTKEEII